MQHPIPKPEKALQDIESQKFKKHDLIETSMNLLFLEDAWDDYHYS